MKIVYVLPTLAWKGGAERIITEKANYFAEFLGYDVIVVCITQGKDQANTYPLSDKVTQIILGIKVYLQYKYSYPKRFWIQFTLRNQIKKQLKSTIQQINPDILIGVGYYRANFVCTIDCRAKKIIECHDGRKVVFSDFMSNNKWLTKPLMAIYKKLYFRSVERHADLIIALTPEAKRKWKNAKRVVVIPNFSTMTINQYSSCTYKRVIAVGRLAWEKGFGRLIEVWRLVCKRFPDWHLDIYGEGSMSDTLKVLTGLYNARNVSFHKFTPEISHEYATSSMCVVTSYFEGFSLVLLEAMRHGVPCIAFDCPSGPRHIINDAYNGFLVYDGDIKLFAERLCQLIEDEDLRKYFSKNAIESTKIFDIDTIMNRLKALLEELTS